MQLGLGPPKPAKPHEPDEWIRRFASLPLMAHPGDAWMYDVSFSVLGVFISRAAGKTFGAVLYENILGPLGMEDTGFHVPKEKVERLAPCYQPGAAGGSLELYDGAGDSRWLQPASFPDAAGGLVSTADNYFEFAQMLLGKGRHRDRRILAGESVDVMTSNQVVAKQRGPASAAFPRNARMWNGHVRRTRSRRRMVEIRTIWLGGWTRDVVVQRPECGCLGDPRESALSSCLRAICRFLERRVGVLV